MNFVVFIGTGLLVVVCLFLILLVLVQLPKKDAGAGMAFGAGTADALFGAGSGNALTKITKYTAVAFLLLSLLLSAVETQLRPQNSASDFTKAVESVQKNGLQSAQPAKPAAAPTTAPATTPASSLLTSVPTATNFTLPAAISTNSVK